MAAKKILIVEDDLILRDILVNKLIKVGFSTFTAEDGIAALEVARKERPDLILLDILLPKKSGAEVLQEMNADPNLKTIPVIAISNAGEPTEIERIKALGAKDFLIKAIFDSGEVVKRVQKLLGWPEKLKSEEGEPQKVFPQTQAPPPKPQLASADPLASQASRPAAGGGKKSVLIIEDDKFLRELAGQKLEREGFRVSGATDGREALEILEKENFDVIILDLILPGIDGYEVLRRMKENPKTAKIPVIILSNLGQAEDIQRAKKLGADEYLVKAHFSFGEIISKIRTVLGMSA